MVQVRLVDAKVGFGVFALAHLQAGQQVYRERSALRATHHADSRGTRDAYERYLGLPPARRDAMHGAFPALAAVNGVAPDDAAEFRGLVGSLVRGGSAVVDTAITADEHRAAETAARRRLQSRRRLHHLSRALSRKKKKDVIDNSTRLERQEVLDWFGRYAFRLDLCSTFTVSGSCHARSQAAVFLLTGLVNHRCRGFFNCRVISDMDGIRLVAERHIAPGEELTIDYGKSTKGFSCRGPCCRRRYGVKDIKILCRQSVAGALARLRSSSGRGEERREGGKGKRRRVVGIK